MRELIADLFISVDGFAAGERSPAFFGYRRPGAWIDEQLATPHIMVMGANTYRALAGIVAAGADANGARMTALPKLAFSATLRPLEWADSTVIADDLSRAVPNLKRQDGEPLRMIGSPPGPQPAATRPGRPAAPDGVLAGPRRHRPGADLRRTARSRPGPHLGTPPRRPAAALGYRTAAPT